eukprot:TRINITY_DN33916_c0_g2_i1.p1 TRINITY_DN33916_c0_g2~~TRINITY_DN33916_c0_g2_i1.p1  ORF type:complete len:713 (-),score=154.24 TRINITY_DN33916_c0_g2_i1:133-2271(-)
MSNKEAEPEPGAPEEAKEVTATASPAGGAAAKPEEQQLPKLPSGFTIAEPDINDSPSKKPGRGTCGIAFKGGLDLLSSWSAFRDSWAEGGSRRVDFHKTCWKVLNLVHRRSNLDKLFPATVAYYDASKHPEVRGCVALTIGNAPGRLAAENCLATEVSEVLRSFNAKATFFVSADFVAGKEAQIEQLLEGGHEIANHCCLDRSYAEDSEADFEDALLRAERLCEELRRRHRPPPARPSRQSSLQDGYASQPKCESPQSPPAKHKTKPVRWFRAPQAKLSATMRQVLNRHGFSTALADCQGHDTRVNDPKFIADSILEHVMDGSVLYLHMPERGDREHNLEALQQLLTHLRQRGLRVLTLTEMHEAAAQLTVATPMATPATALPSSSDLRAEEGDPDSAASPTTTAALSSRLGALGGFAGNMEDKVKDIKTEFHKACWSAIKSVGHREHCDVLFPATICYYNPTTCPAVRGKIALTIDDAPCRQRDTDRCMMQSVLDVLSEFNAKATFFLCTDDVAGHEAGLLNALKAGHEVANHCPQDRSYGDDDEASFEAALLKAEDVCESLRWAALDSPTAHKEDDADLLLRRQDSGRRPEVRWFRAPHARVSAGMRTVLNRHGFTHVLCDCYANDTWIADAGYISDTMLSLATDGSVAVIHMPEVGFREYNLDAIRGFLKGLTERGLQVLSLGELHALAYSGRGKEDSQKKPEAVEAFL